MSNFRLGVLNFDGCPILKAPTWKNLMSDLGRGLTTAGAALIEVVI
jgi:hypothetical protein